MNILQTESKLLLVLDGFQTSLPMDMIDEMRSLVKAGEPGIAFENFCEQLFEYDIPVSRDIMAELSSLGMAMGIRPDYWLRLAVTG